MWRSMILAIVGILVAIVMFVVGIDIHAQAQTRNTVSRRAADRPPLFNLGGVKPCSLKSTLPGVFFAPFECESCCDAAHAARMACAGGSGGKAYSCECIAAGYDACLDGGCGPCQCCADYATLGQTLGCWILEKKK